VTRSAAAVAYFKADSSIKRRPADLSSETKPKAPKLADAFLSTVSMVTDLSYLIVTTERICLSGHDNTTSTEST